MDAARKAGRTMAALFALQMILAPVVNFVLLAPLFAPPGFLVHAAAQPQQVGLAVLLGLVTGAIWVALAIVAWPVFRAHSRALAMWFFALALLAFCACLIENVATFAMLLASQGYAKLAAPDASQFEALRLATSALRNAAHYLNLIIGGGTFLLLFGVLLRYALVPRVLAALGIVGALSQLTAVSMPLFGHPVNFDLIAPLGVMLLALIGWLGVKGLASLLPAASAA